MTTTKKPYIAKVGLHTWRVMTYAPVYSAWRIAAEFPTRRMAREYLREMA